MPIDHTQRTRIEDAILDAFRQVHDLERMVHRALGLRLQNLVAVTNPMPKIVYDLIDRCESQGLLLKLLQGARDLNPGNQLLREVAPALGTLPPDIADFERIVLSSVRFEDIAPWLARLARARRAVCRVEPQPPEDGLGGYGTGFLVTPDVVMTNYHVIAPFLRDARGVRCRFDCEVGLDSVTVTAGRTVPLADRWQVLLSPDNEHDFALIRLAEPVGHERIDGEERGHLDLTAHTFSVGEPLLILQHPDGCPMQLALGAVKDPRPSVHQVSYTVNTEYGSSGSPCFTTALKAVAIHHRRGTALENRGVRFDAILDFLKLPRQHRILQAQGLADLAESVLDRTDAESSAGAPSVPPAPSITPAERDTEPKQNFEPSSSPPDNVVSPPTPTDRCTYTANRDISEVESTAGNPPQSTSQARVDSSADNVQFRRHLVDDDSFQTSRRGLRAGLPLGGLVLALAMLLVIAVPLFRSHERSPEAPSKDVSPPTVPPSTGDINPAGTGLAHTEKSLAPADDKVAGSTTAEAPRAETDTSKRDEPNERAPATRGVMDPWTVIAKAIAAKGGAVNLAKLRAFTSDSKIWFPRTGKAMAFRAVAKLQWPDRYRMDITRDYEEPSFATTEVLDGSKGWLTNTSWQPGPVTDGHKSWYAFTGDPVDLREELLVGMREQFFAMQLVQLRGLSVETVTLKSLGESEVNGKLVDAVRVSSARHHDVILSFDRNSSLLLKSETRP